MRDESTESDLAEQSEPFPAKPSGRKADILLKEQRPGEAEEFARRAFNDQLRTLGPHHQDTLESLRILGEALTRNGRYEEAKKMYTDTISRIGADARYTAREGVVDLWYGLASLAVRVGRRDEAF